MAIDHWLVLHVNPEPWAMGEAYVGKKNGKMFSRISPNQGLVAYQNAIREALSDQPKLPVGQYQIVFYLWRQLATYISDSDRRVQKHQADATNMQKALEDACQGYLFDNDRDVQDIRTRIVSQGPKVIPGIIIRAKLLDKFNTDEIPLRVWEDLTYTEPSPELEFDYENTEVEF